MRFALASQGGGESVVATYADVGTVWGLAYSPADNAVYASAFHKRQLPFGPCGPGGIYRIDLDPVRVSCFAQVPNVAASSHRFSRGHDQAAEQYAGRTSLGDLELNTAASELYVVNLDDRRIYRYAIASGELLGSFPHGAANEDWAAEARPFGLGYHSGYLYHGLVRSGELTGLSNDLRAYVYRSLSDGSDMALAASFDLNYARGVLEPGCGWEGKPLDWGPWHDGHRVNHDWGIPVPVVNPMPLVSDVGFDAEGNMLVAMRDRWADSGAFFVTYRPSTKSRDILGAGFGDILRGIRQGSSWQFDTSSEHYDDDGPGLGPEIAHGGLAGWPHAPGAVLSAFATDDPTGQLAAWFYAGVVAYDDATGDKLEQRRLCHGPLPGRQSLLGCVGEAQGALLAQGSLQLSATAGQWTLAPLESYPRAGQICHTRGAPTLGDVEALSRPTPSPSATATSTSTCTVSPSPPPSATIRPTQTRRPTPRDLYLPVLLWQPTYVPSAAHSDAAKASGIRIFTVGLGTDVDVQALEATSEPAT